MRLFLFTAMIMLSVSVFSSSFSVLAADNLSKISPAAGAEKAVNTNIIAKSPEAFVNKLSSVVINIIEIDGLDEKEREEYLVKLFDKHVDTDWMGNFVLGRYLKKASGNDKKRFYGLYKEYLTRSYVPRFREYEGGQYELVRVKSEGASQYTVLSKLKSKNGKPDVRIDYRLRKAGSEFKIVDVIGEGVSLLTTQRSDFGGLVSKKGLTYFIDLLEKKVDKMKS